MLTIAEAAQEENKSIAVLAAKSQKDANVVRILTFVAMLYLPASLIAVGYNIPVPIVRFNHRTGHL
jgi:hypothetical protein